ncbi:MAG: alpha-glucosidase [Treponemataceae bacterium]|nr:alpha-glucosidase [Treponemataceae bacterium]
MELTLESKIGELYQTPIGKDIINKLLLQLNKSEKLITNPIVSNLKIKTLAKLTKKILGPGFFTAFLNLVNSEKDKPLAKADGSAPGGLIKKVWWKEAVFYQIYPRTFCDSDGDGTGDLKGIISKLDYLSDLGIDAIWLSPIYDSPMDDNGYDIRDYHKILKTFGDMADFDELLSEVHKRNMKLIMDLVVNHTSDEHEWFQKALKDKNSKYHDYYIFRDKPNNWTSWFSGSAWNFYGGTAADCGTSDCGSTDRAGEGEYALHLFSKKQMDLNWENPELRHEVINMINWWLDKGVDGFRMDVINLISKQEGLPDGDELIGNMMGFTGIEHYFYGPHLHEYLRQIHDEAFKAHDAFSVGETPGLGMQMAKLVTGEERGELDMVFSFDHLESPGHTRFDDYEYDLNYYKKYITDWQLNYGANCWNSLFFNNHDNPRMVSKIAKDKTYHFEIKYLLAILQFTLRGTPFVFQGDEMGLENYEFDSIDQINDVESKNKFAELCEKMSEEKAFEIIKAGSREHARILLPWNETNDPIVKQQSFDQTIFDEYKCLIKLRKENPVLVYGDFRVLRSEKNVFTYERYDENSSFIIDCNLSNKLQKAYSQKKSAYKLVNSNSTSQDGFLTPYSARIYSKTSKA